MAETLPDLDRYVVVSADTHAGADVRMYKQYLEGRWHDEFDAWAADVETRMAAMREFMGDRSVGVDGDHDLDANRNWDSARRVREMESDGVVGEVIFPNTQPPFAPAPVSEFEAPALSREDNERRWAGLQAHNRWLADFASELPGRRAGAMQIYLPNVEGSVKEIQWGRENGLFGGIVLPGAPPGSGMAPLYAPEYEPIWSVCADLGVPVNHHAGGATPQFGAYFPQALAMFMLEVRWWSHRALWHLMFSGVFERHPKLQFVLTEVGSGWVPETLEELDLFYRRMKYEEYGSEKVFGGLVVDGLPMTPSEYFQRQCHLGSSFLKPNECTLRHRIGVDRMMWGMDYPHMEGTFPYTRQHLRLTFAGVDEMEVQQMLALNAIDLYDFDVDALVAAAIRTGPTKAEISEPIDYADVPLPARKCPAFAPEHQVVAV
jgi:predicted TIM-barrel fold metal-dependent hydrolase